MCCQGEAFVCAAVLCHGGAPIVDDLSVKFCHVVLGALDDGGITG